MSNDIVSFLASSPVFRDVGREEIEKIAPLFQTERYPAGKIIIHQDGYSHAIYFLHSGRLAVRIQRGAVRETVAFLQPPDIFGELSFLTGRPCVADVEVVIDAEVLLLSKEAVDQIPSDANKMLRGLMEIIALRLQLAVSHGVKAREAPVVLLRHQPHWGAPLSFAAELGRSLARQTGQQTLVVNLGMEQSAEPRTIDEFARVQDVALPASDEQLRPQIAQSLTAWKPRFANIILNPVGSSAAATANTIGEFANWVGDLVGPGDRVPQAPALPTVYFVVQDATRPTLPVLSGTQQLIRDVDASEDAYRSNTAVTPAFLRTVESIGRAINGIQVGLALGGGGAWGWAHIGVLGVLEQARMPIDVISGCSMGSLIGALRACGFSVNELVEIASYWRTRTKRFIEWRFWRMCLINEKVARKVFGKYFGDRTVNQSDIPYWANAVDISTGAEVTIREGSMVDCVRASIALPGLLPPYRSESRLMVDAGIMDPVPVILVRSMGGHFAIGVNAMAALESQKVNPHYPMNAFDIMTRCMFVMGHEMGQARATPAADVVFTPSLGKLTMLHFSRSNEIIECGRRAAEEHLPAIQESYERLRRQRLNA